MLPKVSREYEKKGKRTLSDPKRALRMGIRPIKGIGWASAGGEEEILAESGANPEGKRQTVTFPKHFQKKGPNWRSDLKSRQRQSTGSDEVLQKRR